MVSKIIKMMRHFIMCFQPKESLNCARSEITLKLRQRAELFVIGSLLSFFICGKFQILVQNYWTVDGMISFSDKFRGNSTCMSEVHNVRLSLRSCMIKVLSLYDSSPRVSNSAMASSKAWTWQHNKQQDMNMYVYKLTTEDTDKECLK